MDHILLKVREMVGIRHSEPHLSSGKFHSQNFENRRQNIGKEQKQHETFQELHPWVSQKPKGERIHEIREQK
jgi:hypothetical protein